MLTVWERKTSSNVQALMWCIGELGLRYQRHDAGHIHGVTDAPAFLAMNPNGTVPVLRDGEAPPLWETTGRANQQPRRKDTHIRVRSWARRYEFVYAGLRPPLH